VDLKVPNPEEFFKLLKKKCVQTTFHEDFIIEKKIGKGNFANVYLATKKETGD
jgi:serine/threonine protein kinase